MQPMKHLISWLPDKLLEAWSQYCLENIGPTDGASTPTRIKGRNSKMAGQVIRPSALDSLLIIQCGVYEILSLSCNAESRESKLLA